MEQNAKGEAAQTPERRESLHINSIVIPADDEQPLRQNHLLTGGLAERQHLVGGFIQAVDLGGPPARLYFNEDGKIKELPPNKRATLLLWTHNPAFRYQDFIVGDAFLVGPVRRGADTSVADEHVAMLFEATRFRVEMRPQGEAKWQQDPERFDNWVSAYEHAVGWGAGVSGWRERQSTEVRVVPEE
jgi:hypothetical protein